MKLGELKNMDKTRVKKKKKQRVIKNKNIKKEKAIKH
jgi:hypothetical protein